MAGGAFAATMHQIRRAHSRFEGVGESGEFTLARHGILEPGTNFLSKPFTIREISRAVRRALDDA